MRRLILLAVAAGAAATACRGRPSQLLAFDASMSQPAPPPPTEEPNQIHYTFTGPDAVAFDWRGSGRSLRFWNNNSPPRTVQADAPAVTPTSTAGAWQEAQVGGLVPGADYQYVIGSPARPVSGTFRAPSARGSSGFLFVAAGNVGASTDFPQVASFHRLVALAEPAFVLLLGNLTYADIRAQSSVDRHFEDVMAWSRRAAYLPVWGDHEWSDPAHDDLRNYKGRFALPNAQSAPGAPAAGCCGEDWYWLDYGNLRLIVYPEPYSAGTWDDWAGRAEPLFVEAARDPDLRFVVTAGHRCPYSSGPHGSEPALRRILDGFAKRFPRYVLNLCAQSRVYERTKPQVHVVHITAGSAGAGLERTAMLCSFPECPAPPFTAMRAIHHAFLKVSVQPRTIRIEAVCSAASPGNDTVRCVDGDIMDSVVIASPG